MQVIYECLMMILIFLVLAGIIIYVGLSATSKGIAQGWEEFERLIAEDYAHLPEEERNAMRRDLYEGYLKGIRGS
jgi:hypothetical protein